MIIYLVHRTHIDHHYDESEHVHQFKDIDGVLRTLSDIREGEIIYSVSRVDLINKVLVEMKPVLDGFKVKLVDK